MHLTQKGIIFMQNKSKGSYVTVMLTYKFKSYGSIAFGQTNNNNNKNRSTKKKTNNNNKSLTEEYTVYYASFSF